MPNIDPNALASTLTIRQEFAKAAMQGLLAHSEMGMRSAKIIAAEAVSQADALIAVLNEKEDGQ